MAGTGKMGIVQLTRIGVRLMELIPGIVIALLARFAMFRIFFDSGQTKISGIEVAFSYKIPTGMASKTYYLFEQIYNLPLISPVLAAWLSATAELTLSVMLLVGFGARYAAFGLLIMTAVIEIFVFPNLYITHALWAVALLYIMVNGPGFLSIDSFIRKRYMTD